MNGEPRELTLHHPEALQDAIGILNRVQAGPWTNRPLIGLALEALDAGDVGTATFTLDAARRFTLTGSRDVTDAAELIRQAFQL